MKNYWLNKSLELWNNEFDFIIASSQEDAKQIAMEFCGYSREEVDEWDWCVMPQNVNFEFMNRSKKVSEWISSEGRGYFA